MPAPGGPAGASGPVRRRGEHGSATAELAVLMPGLVLLMTLIVGVAQVGAAHLRCQDAARAAARLAARGEPWEHGLPS